MRNKEVALSIKRSFFAISDGDIVVQYLNDLTISNIFKMKFKEQMLDND